jgi:hypothetical protein
MNNTPKPTEQLVDTTAKSGVINFFDAGFLPLQNSAPFLMPGFKSINNTVS